MRDIKKRIDRLEKEAGLNNCISTFAEWIKATNLNQPFKAVGKLKDWLDGVGACQNQRSEVLK